jgi:fatty acid desaturase
VSSDWDPGHRGIFDVDHDDGGASRPPPRSAPDPDDGRDAPDAGRIAWLLVGALAIAAGTALGWDAEALSAIVTPPATVRAALVGTSVAIGVLLLIAALNRLAAADDLPGRSHGVSARDIGSMIRGVRLVFLAVAAFAAGSGWLLGHPLPLVVALVIAGVDVLETSFLLIVVGLRQRR